MSKNHFFTRSSINLRAGTKPGSSIVDVLGPNEIVEIVEEQGNLAKVRAVRLEPPVSGYLRKSALIAKSPDLQVFPVLKIDGSGPIPSVPPELPLSEFLRWLDSNEEPGWLPKKAVESVRLGSKPAARGLIRDALAGRAAQWDAWVAEVKTHDRLASARLDEWFVILAGGREMWSFRSERIFQHPSEHSAAPAWVSPKDTLHWTGRVHINNQERKYKTWYEVEFAKLDNDFKGWYKADLLEEYAFPDRDSLLVVPENEGTAFDLSTAALRLPADPEIEQARKAGRKAAQYIDVVAALGRSRINHNLCGEFCAAALTGSDLVPLLGKWIPAYKGAKSILETDHGTSIPDLQSLLDLSHLKYEFFRGEASVAPITPGYLRKNLDSGKMAIVGVGITSGGVLKFNSGIRHWVVIEDVIRVQNTGWVRLYNPFANREEVYSFDEVFGSNAASGVGLWVELKQAEAKPGSV